MSTGLHLMHNQESNQPKSGKGGWGCWFLAVLWLGAVLPPVGFVVLVLGLFLLCVAYRWAAIVIGLTLAVTCTVCAISLMTDPESGDVSIGLLFLPWIGLGLWLAFKGPSRE